jgi:hypothetical protein
MSKGSLEDKEREYIIYDVGGGRSQRGEYIYNIVAISY